MNETLQNTIAELLNKFGITFDETKQWTIDTLMPYIKELIERVRTYKIVSNSIATIICVVFFIACFVYFIQVYKKYKQIIKTNKDNFLFERVEEVYPTIFNIVVSVISAFIIIIVFVFGSSYFYELFKWIFIPDVQFIEYISNLISA